MQHKTQSELASALKKIQLLGHVISDRGIRTDPEKIKAVVKWLVLTDAMHELQSFLDLCTYKAYNVARPLHKLTEKQVKYQ